MVPGNKERFHHVLELIVTWVLKSGLKLPANPVLVLELEGKFSLEIMPRASFLSYIQECILGCTQLKEGEKGNDHLPSVLLLAGRLYESI